MGQLAALCAYPADLGHGVVPTSSNHDEHGVELKHPTRVGRGATSGAGCDIRERKGP